MIEPRAAGSTRRSATVTSSEPLTAIASAIASSDWKPPVPSSRREPNALPAITSGSPAGVPAVGGLVSTVLISASLDRHDDLDLRAVGDDGVGPAPARDDLAVDGDGDAARGGGH